MTSKAIPFILGLVVGAAVYAAVLSKKSHPETPVATVAELAASSNQIADLKAELAAANSRLEKANADNDKLAARVQESLKHESTSAVAAEKPKKPRGLAALFGGDGTNEMSEAMGGMMKAAIEQQMEAKLAGMKAKLNLTPEQEKAIREIMTKQMSKGMAAAQKMFSGDLSKEEMEKLGNEPKSEEEQIKALLTPEQIAAYDDYDKEEKTRMARLVANSELMQLQSSLQLTEEQQDKVFAILAEQAQAQINPTNMAGWASGPDYIRKQAEKKAEALRGVLTPEQFERYQKFQEQQMKMYEALMPKDATNVHVHVEVTPTATMP